MIEIKLANEIVAAITQKSDGNIDPRFSDPSGAEKNLMTICNRLGFSAASLVKAQQLHGAEIKIVDRNQAGQTQENADALITADSSVVLLIRVADCMPIFLFDSENRVIAALHAGWRGTLGSIVEKTLRKMKSAFNLDPRKMKVYLGPSIRFCCNRYLRKPLQIQKPEWRAYIRKNQTGFRVDLPGFILQALQKLGVSGNNIMDSGICTFDHPQYYSDRKFKLDNKVSSPEIEQEDQGRFAALIALK